MTGAPALPGTAPAPGAPGGVPWQLPGLARIAEIGTDAARGGWSRHLWQPAELELRAWFVERAAELGLVVETDGNASLWAWWLPEEPDESDAGPDQAARRLLRARDAVVTGSHLDSVPGGGALDGPLGVVSAFDAVERLRREGLVPRRPIAVVAFAEEEGSRFGVACLASRLMTGAISPERALGLVDADGITLERAARDAGHDPARLGPDPERLARIALFVELHIEQGVGLAELGAPLAVGSSILAHGRWRLTVGGEGNHAGATRMSDRSDPVVAAARGILAVDAVAREPRHAAVGARATVGRVRVVPGGTNVIASTVELWLDARADDDEAVRALVADIERAVRVAVSSGASGATTTSGCAVTMIEESWSPVVRFDDALARSIADDLGAQLGSELGSELGGEFALPLLATGAGHDAGVLAAHVPTAMLFVRNPSGVSHAPGETATAEDCAAGVRALTMVLRRAAA